MGLIGLALASLALLIVAASQFPAGHLHVIWPAVIVVVLVEITAHEYAHATVCRTLGVRIREAGIMLWRWFLPVPYVDCTDIYRLPGKRPRVLVALAGPYVDLVAAGACSAAALETTGAVSASAFVLVLAMAAALARNLMPVLPTDGYHALQAVTGELNLRGRSWSHLRDELDGIGLLGRRGHSSHSGTCAERRQRTKRHKHLPVDSVKIDGEFIQNAIRGRIDQLVIDAVVRIAQGLGNETIAEFVTNEQTQRMITRLGVDHAQGYHIGRPIPIPDLLKNTLTNPTR